MEPASGRQFELRRGAHRAVAVEVGATLREYSVDGIDVIDGFPLDRMADGGRGQPLLPWPNRLEDGQYEFQGQTLQVPIDELPRHNANHGLTRWSNWTPVQHTADQVRLRLVLHPRSGYPFTLELAVTYALHNNGLSVQTVARNIGESALPFGAGQHPYFSVGTPSINEAQLTLRASKRVQLDAERRLPTGTLLNVNGTPFDFRTGRQIGETIIDDCFTDLNRDADGRAHVTMSGKRRTLKVWVDEHYKYLQVYTGEALAAERRRRGLAIEPMTCPPNAFRSGTDLLVLQPGESVALEWGVDVDTRLTDG